jgi:hypothetical protein
MDSSRQENEGQALPVHELIGRAGTSIWPRPTDKTPAGQIRWPWHRHDSFETNVVFRRPGVQLFLGHALSI